MPNPIGANVEPCQILGDKGVSLQVARAAALLIQALYRRRRNQRRGGRFGASHFGLSTEHLRTLQASNTEIAVSTSDSETDLRAAVPTDRRWSENPKLPSPGDSARGRSATVEQGKPQKQWAGAAGARAVGSGVPPAIAEHKEGETKQEEIHSTTSSPVETPQVQAVIDEMLPNSGRKLSSAGPAGVSTQHSTRQLVAATAMQEPNGRVVRSVWGSRSRDSTTLSLLARAVAVKHDEGRLRHLGMWDRLLFYTVATSSKVRASAALLVDQLVLIVVHTLPFA